MTVREARKLAEEIEEKLDTFVAAIEDLQVEVNGLQEEVEDLQHQLDEQE